MACDLELVPDLFGRRRRDLVLASELVEDFKGVTAARRAKVWLEDLGEGLQFFHESACQSPWC
jgi:hypothetical protein